MGRSSLKQLARDHYRNAPVSSWILGLTTGILIAAILAIDLLVPTLCIFTFPLIILPIIFAGSLQHVVLNTQGQITMSSSLRAFGLYYRPDFFGCFSYFISLLKSILSFLIIELAISSVTSYIFMYLVPGFSDTVNHFMEILESGSLEIESLNELLEMNGGILFIYSLIVILPSFAFAVIFFIYNISRNSLNIYYRLHTRAANGRLVRYIYKDVVRRNRMRMFKDYLSLNWPLYLILLFGMGGGAAGGFFWTQDLITIITCMLVGGAFLSSFFLPFYFGNQEALYDAYVEEFKISTNNVSQFFLRNLQANIEMTQEEKERLEKSLQNMEEPLEDENKKDPDGPSE